MNTVEELDELLVRLPYQRPFRFVDEILEVDDNHIVGSYRYRTDEFFYPAHFPGNPVTPGVILIETMAQIGIVALGLFLTSVDTRLAGKSPPILFTETRCQFTEVVRPGDTVIVRAQKEYFRRLKLKVAATMTLKNGSEVCSGTLAGMRVPL